MRKLYYYWILSLILLLAVGMLLSDDFYIKSGVPLFLAGVSLPLALLHWLPIWLDRSPAGNKRRSYSFFRRLQFNLAFVVFSFLLVWGNLIQVVAPAWTNAFGTSETRELVVTIKSDGSRVRRGCDHYVHLRDGVEVFREFCLSRDVWATVHAGAVLRGSVKKSFFGRAIKNLSIVS